MQCTEQKDALRTRMRTERRAMDPAVYRNASAALCAQLKRVSPPTGAVIAGYHAIGNEVDIADALAQYHARQHPLCMPVVSGAERVLRFMEWSPACAMRAGPHGTMEPVSGSLFQPDWLLVPLLAFDRRGYRLGYGGGYYDATIAALRAKNPEVRAVGVAFGFQEVDALPVEAHDATLDMIVTEKEVITP